VLFSAEYKERKTMCKQVKYRFNSIYRKKETVQFKHLTEERGPGATEEQLAGQHFDADFRGCAPQRHSAHSLRTLYSKNTQNMLKVLHQHLLIFFLLGISLFTWHIP
jgi:hypothetical protein